MSIQIPESATTDSDKAKEELLERFEEPRRKTRQALAISGDLDERRHTDADSIRRHFGIPAWDRSKFDYPQVVPNLIEKTHDPPAFEAEGGTDFFARGKPGSGKSTLANYLAARELDVNDAIVVWRGSSARSEWLPLAPWTRLCLPKGVDVEIRLEAKNPADPSILLDVEDLERIVREVVRYSDPIDLNHRVLQHGAFHVVYPDPRMRGCQALYGESDRTVEPPTGRELFDPEDPADHWWFAWVLARVDHGPHHWTTWIADEIGDIAPQSVQKDRFGSYQKVTLLRDSWVDLRKMGVTVHAYGHAEEDVSDLIRRKLRWRIQMPGQANPTSPSKVVGFDSVPMNADVTSKFPVGKALCYTETKFDYLGWKDMPRATNHNLKIKVS
ncbi:hypothetical protein [Halomontanus rarus]|uniref:hypothetical protein n=1 Tax=Halomontanus rarus TaxID=3034020 RepID=UPI0023E75AD8|nr:hypothetical protein [Halovivax sp. TS33]